MGEPNAPPPAAAPSLANRIAVLADARLGGPGGPAGPLVEQLAALPAAGCGRLLVMGDLFQAWVGHRRFETPEVTAMVAALRRLRERGVRAVHGDGLDDDDWQYRFWRRLSKSGLSRRLAGRIPGPLARRIVSSTERRLARTNFKHRHRLPEAAIRAYAERRLAEGHDVLLLGHFHEARTWRVPGGEVRLLAAWFKTRTLEWLVPATRPAL